MEIHETVPKLKVLRFARDDTLDMEGRETMPKHEVLRFAQDDTLKNPFVNLRVLCGEWFLPQTGQVSRH
jgi:hypothetical protein